MICTLSMIQSSGISVPAGPVILVMCVFLFLILPNERRMSATLYAGSGLLLGVVLLGLAFLSKPSSTQGPSAIKVAAVSFFFPILGTCAVLLAFVIVRKLKKSNPQGLKGLFAAWRAKRANKA